MTSTLPDPSETLTVEGLFLALDSVRRRWTSKGARFAGVPCGPLPRNQDQALCVWQDFAFDGLSYQLVIDSTMALSVLEWHEGRTIASAALPSGLPRLEGFRIPDPSPNP